MRTLWLAFLASTFVHAAPLRLGTPANSFEPGATVQLRATGRDGGAGTELAPELRRLRLFARSRLADGLLRFGLQLNFTPAALELVDLWAEVNLAQLARFRAGQIKTPFTRHRQLGFMALPLADWDLAALAIGAERQRGVMWLGTAKLGADWRFEAALGVFTGDNARAAFARGLADAWRVPLPNRSDFRTFSAGGLHPELVGRVTVESAEFERHDEVDWNGGPLRFSASVSGAWDSAPVERVDFSRRLALEGLVAWQRWSLLVMAFAGWERALALTGGTLELSRAFEGRVLVAGRWSLVARLPGTGAVGARPTLHEVLGAVRAPLGVEWLTGHLEAGGVVDDLGASFRLRAQVSLTL